MSPGLGEDYKEPQRGESMVAEEQIHTAPEGRKIFPMLTEILHMGYLY
jgi:hypothetical protein